MKQLAVSRSIIELAWSSTCSTIQVRDPGCKHGSISKFSELLVCQILLPVRQEINFLSINGNHSWIQGLYTTGALEKMKGCIACMHAEYMSFLLRMPENQTHKVEKQGLSTLDPQ